MDQIDSYVRGYISINNNIDYYITNYLSKLVDLERSWCRDLTYYFKVTSLPNQNRISIYYDFERWSGSGQTDSGTFLFPISFFAEDEEIFKAKVDRDLVVSRNNRLKLAGLEELIEKANSQIMSREVDVAALRVANKNWERIIKIGKDIRNLYEAKELVEESHPDIIVTLANVCDNRIDVLEDEERNLLDLINSEIDPKILAEIDQLRGRVSELQENRKSLLTGSKPQEGFIVHYINADIDEFRGKRVP